MADFKLRLEAAIAMNAGVVTFLEAVPNSLPMAGEAEAARVALIAAVERVNELMAEDLRQVSVGVAYAADGDPSAAETGSGEAGSAAGKSGDDSDDHA